MNYKWHANYQLLPEIAEDCRIFAVVVKITTALILFTFHFHALKEMATHSSVLAWRIPGTGEPGGLQSMGSRRVGHNGSDLAAAVIFPSITFLSNNITFLNCVRLVRYERREPLVWRQGS